MFTDRSEVNGPSGRRPPRPAAGADGPSDGAVDLSALTAFEEAQAEGEPDLIVELIDLFLEEAPARLAAMRATLEAGGAAALTSAAHSLKGSSANLGARRMAALCEELELSCAGGGTAAAGPILDRLTRAFEIVRLAFAAERERRS